MIMKRLGFTAVALMGFVLTASGVARGDMLSVTLTDVGFGPFAPFTASGGDPASLVVSVPNSTYGNFSVTNASSKGNNTIVGIGIVGTTTLDIQSSVADTLTISVDWTDLNVPAGSGTLDSALAQTGFRGVTGSSLSLTSTLDSVLATAGPETLLPAASGNKDDMNPVVTSVSPFGLHQLITLTFGTGGGDVQFTATTTLAVGEGFVPEPSKLVGIFGIAGMLGLGLVWNNRRRFSV
jgi:hypothetical protein